MIEFIFQSRSNTTGFMLSIKPFTLCRVSPFPKPPFAGLARPRQRLKPIDRTELTWAVPKLETKVDLGRSENRLQAALKLNMTLLKIIIDT